MKNCSCAIKELGDECRVYGSDIPHGDDSSEESKQRLLVDNTARLYGLED